MSRTAFTNLDSLWLAMHVDSFDRASPEENEIAARLLRIAENLQRMDEQNAALVANNSFEQGYATAEARMRRRSNILANPEGEDAEGNAIIAQINQRVKAGGVRKVPLGERALDDKPHEFNGPRRAREKPIGAVPAVDLDLDFLGEL